MSNAAKLRTVKLLHTLVWAVFAGCILLIPLAALLHQHTLALGLIAFVMLEVVVLVLNRMRCPLTDIAARYTQERQPNFDIYLPEWLARYNKLIFGSIYLLGGCYVWWSWPTA